MKELQIGQSGLKSSAIAYGCMRIAQAWDNSLTEGERLRAGLGAVDAALEAGYTLFDHADNYCRGKSEEFFGEALRADPSIRERVVIATKCGCRPDPFYRWDFSYEHITRSCEGSLKRLGVETIDIYQLHRPDYLADPEELCRAFCDLRAAGKVRHFGLSNHAPSRFAMIQKALPFPLVVHQVRISLLARECFDDGTLDQCVADKVTPLAYGPVARGILAAGSPADDAPEREQTVKLLDTMDKMAAEYGVGRDVIALAWLRKHPSRIIPIIGTIRPERIRSAAKAAQIELTRDQWYQLLVAARGKNLP